MLPALLFASRITPVAATPTGDIRIYVLPSPKGMDRGQKDRGAFTNHYIDLLKSFKKACDLSFLITVLLYNIDWGLSYNANFDGYVNIKIKIGSI